MTYDLFYDFILRPNELGANPIFHCHSTVIDVHIYSIAYKVRQVAFFLQNMIVNRSSEYNKAIECLSIRCINNTSRSQLLTTVLWF